MPSASCMSLRSWLRGSCRWASAGEGQKAQGCDTGLIGHAQGCDTGLTETCALSLLSLLEGSNLCRGGRSGIRFWGLPSRLPSALRGPERAGSCLFC